MKRTKNWYTVLIPEETNVSNNGTIVVNPPVCRTTRYDMLGELEGNRGALPSHIKKMLNSVYELGSNNRDIIVVELNGKYVVADGMHLFLGLRSAGLPIRFKLVSASSLKEAVAIMRKMNSTSRNWVYQQFVKANASLNEDYALLIKLFDENNIQIKLLSGLMYCTQKFNSTKASNAVKNGTFQVNVTIAEISKRIRIIKRFYEKTNLQATNYSNLGLIVFMFNKMDTYLTKEKEFLHAVKNIVLKKDIKSYGSKNEYINLFTQCWNNL